LGDDEEVFAREVSADASEFGHRYGGTEGKGRVVSDEDATEEATEETHLVPLIQNTVQENGKVSVETRRKGRGGKRTFDAARFDVLEQGHDVRGLSPVWYSLNVDVPVIREILHVRRVGRILQNKNIGQTDEGEVERRANVHGSQGIRHRTLPPYCSVPWADR
jgi:hypothetical protein